MKTELDKIKHKREYLNRLEDILDNLYELYSFEDVKEITDLFDVYNFTKNLDEVVIKIENEIERQENKLNQLESSLITTSE